MCAADELRVPLEAAAREDDALARPDARRLAGPFDHEADDVAVVVGHERTRGRFHPRLDAPLEQPLEQSGDECGSLRSDVLAFAALELRGELGGRRGEVLGERGRGAEGHQRAPTDEAIGPLGELGAHGVGVGLHAARRHRPLARDVPGPVVVGQRRDVGGERRVRLEVAQNLGRGVDEHLEQLGIGFTPRGHAPDVRQRVLAAVVDPGFGHLVVAGQPDPAARDRGRPAEHVGLLGHEHLGALIVRQRGRGQRRASRTDDDDVDDLVPLHDDRSLRVRGRS